LLAVADLIGTELAGDVAGYQAQNQQHKRLCFGSTPAKVTPFWAPSVLPHESFWGGEEASERIGAFRCDSVSERNI